MPNTVNPRAFADGTSSTGTIRGVMAERVGWLTATKPWLTASSAVTTTTESTSRIACSHSRTAVSAIPLEVIISRVRRSWLSAMAPPRSPNTMSGTSATIDATPTAALLPVRSKICCCTATTLSCEPIAVARPPTNNRRKAGYASGRGSGPNLLRGGITRSATGGAGSRSPAPPVVTRDTLRPASDPIVPARRGEWRP